MGGKSGGGYDTAGMEAATEKSIALQKQIYEQTRDDVQPWYQAGVGGINRLSDLLGISGGSVQNRDQMYNSMLPQYTTTTQASGGNMIALPNGQTINLDTFNKNELSPELLQYQGQLAGLQSGYQAGGDMKSLVEDQGFSMVGGYMPGGESIDYEGLNSAIDDRLGSQGTPEGYGSLLERFDMSKFEEDPGAQYRRDQAQQGLERSMAAQGVTLGGAGYGSINPQVAKALEEQRQGIASQEYGQAFDRYNIDQQNTYNRLMGIAGMGQGSTGQMSAAGQAYGTNVGNLQTGLAGAQANMAASQASQPSMFSQLLGAGAQLGAGYLSGGGTFSDIRLKKNIKAAGVEQGHNIYEWDFRDGSGRYRGVMAHEVQKIEPDAVTEHPNGYLMVDYDKIGLEMERV